MTDALIGAGVLFGRSLVGIVLRPYETYRRIVDRVNVWELAYVAALMVLYFATASMVKTAAFRPFLLTKQFVVLYAAALATYLVTVGLFWGIGKLLGTKGGLRSLLVGWGYSLIPTLVWFWSTSILYVLIPPPRTTSVAGIGFSVMYLLFSAILLFWKIILGYLALRFALKLDLVRIGVLSAIVLPLLCVYSIGMYRMGIFRIPFI